MESYSMEFVIVNTFRLHIYFLVNISEKIDLYFLLCLGHLDVFQS